jgi:protein-S-isoprenylcysteine O-methyltransferase Ste14
MDIVYRVIVAAVLLGFIAHRGYYTRKVQHAAEAVLEQPKAGTATRIAALLAIPALLSTLLYVIKPEWMAWTALPLAGWLRWLGVGIALGGFVLLQWSQQTLGKNWSDAPRLVKDQDMIARGPYRWIRHPIYAAFLLILGALLLISASWLVGGLWLAMSGLDISARIRTEEAMLQRRFDRSYQEYMRTTGRLIPRIVKSKGIEV